MEQELLTLPEHVCSPLVLVGFVLLSTHFRCSVLQIAVCPFGHCITCSSIYGFWLPLWYFRFATSDCPFGIIKLYLDYYVFSVPTKVWMQIRLDGNSDTGCQSSIRYHLRGQINGRYSSIESIGVMRRTRSCKMFRAVTDRTCKKLVIIL